MKQIFLPWPSSKLSPNSRQHWASLARAKREYRHDCFWAARKHGAEHSSAESLTVKITIHPPDARRRDTDNILASLKSGLDGVADAIGIDDSRWTLVICPVGEKRKGGAIILEVTES